MQKIKYILFDTVKHDAPLQEPTDVVPIVDGYITNVEVVLRVSEAYATQLIGFLSVELITGKYESSLNAGAKRSDIAEFMDIANDIALAFHTSDEAEVLMLVPLDKIDMVTSRRVNVYQRVNAGQPFTIKLDLQPILASAFGATGEAEVFVIFTQEVSC